MRKITLMCSLVLLSLALTQASRAQDTAKTDQAATAPEPAPDFYHLVLVVQELDADNKPVNSRTYTTTVSTDSRYIGSIRTGSHIPVVTESRTGPVPALPSTTFQYNEAKVNFDFSRVKEFHRQLSLDLSADVISLADGHDTNLHQPIIRENQWHTSILIPIGKATTIFTSDLLDNKGSMQVVVTATPLQ
ncbi:MAG TPA: hypothetical protein VE291_03380 [Terracidiphilus sp.]|jgi:hypothetical protein|nr:hypothetical protein [Terracidiphilus sp.]